MTLNNLGSVYRKMQLWPEAQDFYQRAINIYETLNLPARMAHSKENLGLIFLADKSYDAALNVFIQSFHFFEQKKNQVASLRLLLLLSETQINNSKLAAAAKYLNQAQAIDLILGPSAHSTALKLNLGRLLSAQGQYQQAQAILLAGVKFSKEQNDIIHTLALYHALIENAVKFNQFKAAFEYQALYTTAALANYKLNFNNELVTTRAGFEFDQQTQKIILLNKNNEIKQLTLINQRAKFALLSIIFLLFTITSISFIFWQKHKRALIEKNLHTEINWHKSQFAKLGVNHRRLSAAFGELKQALLIINNSQQVIFINNACCKLLEIKKKKHHQFNHG